MVISRHLCDICLEYMKVEKIGEEYILKCPLCDKKKERDEYNFSE